MTKARIHKIIMDEMILSEVDGSAYANLRAADKIFQEVESEKQELIEALIQRVSTDFVYVKSGEINIEDITGDIDILKKHTGKTIEELLK